VLALKAAASAGWTWAGLLLLFAVVTLIAARSARNEVVLDQELRFSATERAPSAAAPVGDRGEREDGGGQVTLLEVGDLTADVTREVHALVHRLEAIYGPGRLHVVFKHRPLAVHPQAELAAELACGVNELAGPLAFQDFVERVLENTHRLSPDDLLTWAQAAAGDPRRLAEGVRAGTFRAQVEADVRQVAQVGPGGARLVVNGHDVDPLATEDQLRDVLDRELGAAAPPRAAPRAAHAVFTRPFDLSASGRTLRIDSTVALPADRSLGARVSLLDLATGDMKEGSLDLSSYQPRAWGEYWGGPRRRTTDWFGRVAAGPHALRFEPTTEVEKDVPPIHVLATSDVLPLENVARGAAGLLALLVADSFCRSRRIRRDRRPLTEVSCDT
jgi:hypothetical protein